MLAALKVHAVSLMQPLRRYADESSVSDHSLILCIGSRPSRSLICIRTTCFYSNPRSLAFIGEPALRSSLGRRRAERVGFEVTLHLDNAYSMLVLELK